MIGNPRESARSRAAGVSAGVAASNPITMPHIPFSATARISAVCPREDSGSVWPFFISSSPPARYDHGSSRSDVCAQVTGVSRPRPPPLRVSRRCGVSSRSRTRYAISHLFETRGYAVASERRRAQSASSRPSRQAVRGPLRSEHSLTLDEHTNLHAKFRRWAYSVFSVARPTVAAGETFSDGSRHGRIDRHHHWRAGP